MLSKGDLVITLAAGNAEKPQSYKVSNDKRSPCLLYCDVRFLMTTDARGKKICILLLNESSRADIIS